MTDLSFSIDRVTPDFGWRVGFLWLDIWDWLYGRNLRWNKSTLVQLALMYPNFRFKLATSQMFIGNKDVLALEVAPEDLYYGVVVFMKSALEAVALSQCSNIDISRNQRVYPKFILLLTSCYSLNSLRHVLAFVGIFFFIYTSYPLSLPRLLTFNFTSSSSTATALRVVRGRFSRVISLLSVNR